MLLVHLLSGQFKARTDIHSRKGRWDETGIEKDEPEKMLSFYKRRSVADRSMPDFQNDLPVQSLL
jgi:hypothetical protein